MQEGKKRLPHFYADFREKSPFWSSHKKMQRHFRCFFFNQFSFSLSFSLSLTCSLFLFYLFLLLTPSLSFSFPKCFVTQSLRLVCKARFFYSALFLSKEKCRFFCAREISSEFLSLPFSIGHCSQSGRRHSKIAKKRRFSHAEMNAL